MPAEVLDAASMTMIHRDGEAFIALARKNDARHNGWQNLGSVQGNKLASLLPGFAAELIRDSYFSVNGFHHPSPLSTTAPLNLPYAVRTQERLRRLNACYVDLDVGRPGEPAPRDMDVVTARSRAFAMMQMGIIPTASIFGFSGRGLYLIWLLKDEDDPEMPQRAWPEKVVLWKQVNAALSDKLVELAADRSVGTDPVRVLRIPGSINTKSKQPVQYSVTYENHQVISYSLKELAESVGVSALNTRKLLWRETKNPGSVPNRRNGYEAVNKRRLDDLVTIEQDRGGFLKRGLLYPDATTSTGRLKALTIYATTLRGADFSQAEALKAVTAMASNCRPPYPSDPNDTPIETLVKNIYSENCWPWRNETICAHLGVSTEMAERLGLKTIIPSALKQKRKSERVTKEQHAKNRQSLVQYLFTERKIKTCRDLASACANHGIKASQQTIANDLKTLGLKSNHRGGRPSKQVISGQESLPFDRRKTQNADAVALQEAQAKLLEKRRQLGR